MILGQSGEMADALSSGGSTKFWCVGSNPTSGTIITWSFVIILMYLGRVAEWYTRNVEVVVSNSS